MGAFHAGGKKEGAEQQREEKDEGSWFDSTTTHRDIWLSYMTVIDASQRLVAGYFHFMGQRTLKSPHRGYWARKGES